MYAAAAVVIGFQAIMFAMFTKAFAINAKLLPPDARLDRLFRVINLEKGLLVGAAMVLAGLGTSFWAINDWGQHEFGQLDPQRACGSLSRQSCCLCWAARPSWPAFSSACWGCRGASGRSA